MSESGGAGKFLLGFIMRRLEECWALLRSGDANGALQVIYDLIVFLDPEIQKTMEPIERRIEAVSTRAVGGLTKGSEYGQAVQLANNLQHEARKIIREATRVMMIELHKAGYFDSEKGSGFYDPSRGAKDTDSWRNKKLGRTSN